MALRVSHEETRFDEHQGWRKDWLVLSNDERGVVLLPMFVRRVHAGEGRVDRRRIPKFISRGQCLIGNTHIVAVCDSAAAIVMGSRC
jgi:hypothetical protein